MKFTLDVNALSGALKIAAIDDIRYYLNGVLLEFDTRTIVATDGHCLIAVKDAIADIEGENAAVILPREFAERFVKVAKKERICSVPLDLTGDTVSFTWGSATHSAKVIDGKYPEWRRIVPSKLSLETAQFNPDLLAQVKAAMALASGFSPKKWVGATLNTNGSGPAVMSATNSSILAVVMPCRMDEPSSRPASLDVAHGPAIEEAEQITA